MKVLLVSVAILAVLVFGSTLEMNPDNVVKPDAPTVSKGFIDTVWYHNGEVLYPDYVHEDTLIVTDADFLNQQLILNKYEVEGDGDIADLLRSGTKIINQ